MQRSMLCPVKFRFARKELSRLHLGRPRILDIGCGNHSPTMTKKWFPQCEYAGADIQKYNLSAEDETAMDVFYEVGADCSGYEKIPDASYDFIILHHVLEHSPHPENLLDILCSKLRSDGVIWIAFPSLRSLSLPSARQTLQFCDDPTHIYVPDIRSVANVLLRRGIKVIHAGQSHDFLRSLIGAFALPFAMAEHLFLGKISCTRLWYILGFEDHVFGKRVTGA